MTASRDFVIAPGGRLDGCLRVPGDKSISHRALLLGAIAVGETHIANFLDSADCLATLAALRKLGVEIHQAGSNTVTLQGCGAAGLRAPTERLDCGNSGTSMRLLMGLLAGQPFESVLTGDASLVQRPMSRVMEPLTRMGAEFSSLAGHAPITMRGQRPLKPLRYEMPLASAQVKSSVLLAGLHAGGQTWIMELATTRDHTERMLESFGCPVLREGQWLGVHGGTTLHATNITVPGDLSSAAFFLAAAAAQTDAHILVQGVGVNPSRDGVIQILRRMGADIRLLHPHTLGNEPVVDVEVYGGALHGVDIEPEQVPLAIDELPALLIAAASAQGVTTLHGATELRLKESDRLQAMAVGLRSLGVELELWDDGMQVTGRERFSGGEIASFGDHRIAMAFSMAALHADSDIRIRDCGKVDTSFPGFDGLAREAGLRIQVEDGPAV